MHATCIAVDGKGALLVGPSGSGKSDLALRCITQTSTIDGRPMLAGLVADDQVVLERRGDRIWGRAPDTIRGKLEVRGLGIVEVSSLPEAQIKVVIELKARDTIPRLPDPPGTTELLGQSLPVLAVAPFEASTPTKILLALIRVSR
jgi:serine kinase of HPr protein (carbohydrate metabolism regulator)